MRDLDEQQVINCLDRGINVNEGIPFVHKGNVPPLTFLIECSIADYYRDKDGKKAAAIFNLFRAKGAKGEKDDLLRIACEQGARYALVENLVEESDQEKIHKLDHLKRNLLHLTCSGYENLADRVKTLKLLLSKGLSAQAKDDIGRTPLLTFCQIETYKYNRPIPSGEEDGKTIKDLVETLLAAGADISDVDEYLGEGIIIYPAVMNNLYLVQLLLEKGAKQDATREVDNKNILHTMLSRSDMMKGHFEEISTIINILNPKKFDFSAQDNNKKTALDRINMVHKKYEKEGYLEGLEWLKKIEMLIDDKIAQRNIVSVESAKGVSAGKLEQKGAGLD
jgi:hypothetical protein